MDADLDAALARVADVIRAQDSDEIGIRIPILVRAILDEEPDDELLELVRSAMSSRHTTVTLPEVVKGVLGLVQWRESVA